MPETKSKRSIIAAKYWATVQSLKRRTDVDWTPYEDGWLESQARRFQTYFPSDDQRKILNQLIAAATLFRQYSEYSVAELIKMIYPHRSELTLDEEEFVAHHYEAGTIELPVRLVRYLASLYRRRELLQRDESVEGVFQETFTEDTLLRDYEAA